MSDPFEITSIKGLIQWLKVHSGKSDSWYARHCPHGRKRLFISSTPFLDVQWDSFTSDRRAMFPFRLPMIEDARTWWLSFWEQAISIWRFSPVSNVIVLAKEGAWYALPNWHLWHAKEEFVEISDDFAKEVCGSDFSQMIDEHHRCGLSTRTLDAEVSNKLIARINQVTS